MLEAEIELFYEVGSGDFAADVNPVAREAVLTLPSDKTWAAYFAREPGRVYTGSYSVKATDSKTALTIEIIHDGSSAGGSDNRVVLKEDGTFRETSITGTGEASELFRVLPNASWSFSW